MDELIGITREVVDKLSDISGNLETVPTKLDQFIGIYGVDDLTGELISIKVGSD